MLRVLRTLGVPMQRVKVDIKDFEPAGLPALVSSSSSGQPDLGSNSSLRGRTSRSSTDPKQPSLAKSSNGQGQPPLGSGSGRRQPDEGSGPKTGQPNVGSSGGHPGQPWVGMGKHLCGAATDFTLCCLSRSARNNSHSDDRPGTSVLPSRLLMPQAILLDCCYAEERMLHVLRVITYRCQPGSACGHS